ncbi:hypothetical protein [Streptomyces sp. NPDC059009]|uniref:hypothetical protein n=1 Tax=Streptomyces sp. NPDC059009 TaxID=3346694 RepID=UPI0036892728
MATNYMGVDDMPHCIARILEPLWRFLIPASVRHQSTERAPSVPPSDQVTRRQEAGRQRERRRVLVLAMYGIDAGPRWTHAVEVGA